MDRSDAFFQDEVAAAEKSIDEKTNALVSKGRWMVPGYKVCATLRMTEAHDSDNHNRRSLATSPLCNRLEPTRPIPFVYSSIVDTITQDGGQQRAFADTLFFIRFIFCLTIIFSIRDGLWHALPIPNVCNTRR